MISLRRALGVPYSTIRKSGVLSLRLLALPNDRCSTFEDHYSKTPTNASPSTVCYFHSTSNVAIHRRRRRAPAGIMDRTSSAAQQQQQQQQQPQEAATTESNSERTTKRSNSISDTKQIVNLTTEEFRVQASQLISRIHSALTPLEPINRDMIVSQGRNESTDNNVDDEKESLPIIGDYLYIDLGPLHGHYTIQADERSNHIIFLSPISGQHIYRYNISGTSKPEDPSRWICTEDGHILEGLLVRDLIRQIQGVPNL